MSCAGMRPRGAVAAGCAFLIWSMSLHGLAQAPATEPSAAQLELARSLFYDGLSLMDQQQWAEAADRFERVLEIRDSIVVSYHAAVAYSRLGRQLDARKRVRRMLDDPELTAEMRVAARDLLNDVEAAMGRLTLRLRGDSEGVRILLDGREVPTAALDVPMPVDPGRVHVVIERDDEVVAESTVEVGGAADLHAQVELEVPAREPALIPVSLSPRPTHATSQTPRDPLRTTGPEPRDEDGGLLSRWWFWTAVGVVAAGAAVTVIALGAEADPADPSAVRGDFEPGLLEGRVDMP